MKNDLTTQRDKLHNEILDLRKELMEIQGKINDIGKGNTFIKLFSIPFILSFIVFFILKIIGIKDSQNLGIFISVFIAVFVIITIKTRKDNEKKENQYKDIRISLQQKIVKKGKELKELEDMINKETEKIDESDKL